MTRRGQFKILIAPAAVKSLASLRGPVQDHVRGAIRGLANDPTPPESIAMRGKGAGLHRLRVGEYRVVYRLRREKVTVLVIRIGHRGDVYRGFEPLELCESLKSSPHRGPYLLHPASAMRFISAFTSLPS